MKRYLLPVLITLNTLNVLQAAPVFQPARTDLITSKSVDLLQSCIKIDFMFKECTWQNSYAVNETGKISVPKGFRESPQTSVIVDGNFNKTFGDFRLSIDGVIYPLMDKDGEQSFVLPNGTNNSLSIAIVSGFSGSQYAESDTSAMVRKISLKLDNTALVDSVLKTIQDQSDKVEADLKKYQDEKRFLRFFSQTDKEIGQIKFNLTGRKANDLSDDCQKPDRLLPDECGYLVAFNRYLRGDKSEFTEESKAKAFEKLTDTNTELKGQIEFLELAGKEVAEEIKTTYESTLEFIQNEKKPVTEEPTE